jgi:MinD superfamily P-loop ATPase
MPHMTKEITILSGKGGTGKTSVSAAFSILAPSPSVVADCDVDAADMHLLLQPTVRNRNRFFSGNEAKIRQEDCIGCGACLTHCRYDAVRMEPDRTKGDATFSIDPIRCEGCGVCVRFCPANAIDFPERFCGEWFVSDTRCGPMVHAKLGVASENSGKLVSVVRTKAKEIAEGTDAPFVIVDGPPGIGCPVIASMSGVQAVVLVTEPSVSGRHDVERVMRLARHFGIASFLIVNKWDICPEGADSIEEAGRSLGAVPLGRIGYDPDVTAAQMAGKSAIEHSPNGETAKHLKKIWENLCRKLK